MLKTKCTAKFTQLHFQQEARPKIKFAILGFAFWNFSNLLEIQKSKTPLYWSSAGPFHLFCVICLQESVFLKVYNLSDAHKLWTCAFTSVIFFFFL